MSISGEDTITIDKKYAQPWTGRLPTRFLILTNELPYLADSSGALASRFIVLVLTKSFYGQENPRLTDELVAELPGIFNWSLDGLERLRDRGYFVPPEASADAVSELEDLGSPMAAFVRDRWEVGAGRSVAVDTLYQAWRVWCEAHGRDHPGTAQTFGRDLRAVLPGIKGARPRHGGTRQRVYEGVGLAATTMPRPADQRGPEDVDRDGPRTTPLLAGDAQGSEWVEEPLR